MKQVASQLCWDLQHASKDTARAMIASFTVATGLDIVDPAFVDRVVQEVYQRIFIKKAVEVDKT